MYINNQLTGSFSQSYTLPTIVRTNCLIGLSNWPGDEMSWSILDDMRFYNKSLTQTEIIQVMNENGKSLYFLYYLFCLRLNL